MSTGGRTLSWDCRYAQIKLAAKRLQRALCINVLSLIVVELSLVLSSGMRTASTVKRDAHSVNCQADVAIFFEFACSICGKKYSTEEKLNVHMTEHNWAPRVCGWPGCQDQTVHQTRNQLRAHTALVHQDLPTDCWICNHSHGSPVALKRHVRAKHPEVTEDLDELMPNQKRQAHKKDAFKPQRCSFPDCTYQTVFASRSQHRDHLRNHGVKGSTLDQYVQDNPEDLRSTTPPRVRAANFVPQRCTHPDCSCRQTFGHRHKLAAHLLEYHGVWKDEDIALFVETDSPVDSNSGDDPLSAQPSDPRVSRLAKTRGGAQNDQLDDTPIDNDESRNPEGCNHGDSRGD